MEPQVNRSESTGVLAALPLSSFGYAQNDKKTSPEQNAIRLSVAEG